MKNETLASLAGVSVLCGCNHPDHHMLASSLAALMRMKRKRLKLQPHFERIRTKPRPADYLRLRFYWLHELRQLRAKRRISNTASKKDIKIAQKELARIRREHE